MVNLLALLLPPLAVVLAAGARTALVEPVTDPSRCGYAYLLGITVISQLLTHRAFRPPPPSATLAVCGTLL